MRSYDRLFIGGQWISSSGTETVDVVSPHSEEVVGHAPAATADDGLRRNEGRSDLGVMASGQVVGLIDDLPSCAELIGAITGEAEGHLARLGRMASGG